jgi:hypothetical protein
MNQGINVLTKKPEKTSTSTSETGMIPRIYETGPIPSIGEESNGEHEPPQPPTLPELDDASSITGVLHIKMPMMPLQKIRCASHDLRDVNQHIKGGLKVALICPSQNNPQ